MYMRVIITKNYQDMSAKAARFVLAQLWRNPKSVLGLATGATPIGMYQELVDAYKKKQIDFNKVTTFNLDEYVGIAPKDPASYHSFMKEHLFSGVNIPAKNQHIPKGDAPDPHAEAQRYEQSIQKAGGIDLQLLGIAPNGHIGFSEPGTPFHPLSKREMEVLSCVVRGMSNKEIALLLGISHQTVKNHVTAILRKFGVEDRTQAVVYALKRGWVQLNEDEKDV